ncbi:LysR family transcriptional regulator [Actinobacillus porcinus]|uniref:LysR family transcriptional regulator n=1 Tax=Actinobacillus porcinus TaxID=51048 RepID=UPI0023521F77|nr:LysR family transcriptional regulator [Actinobacillus porcinus]
MDSSVFGYLTIFHTIVIEGNISKAGRKLSISPAAVSSALKLLEKHIGLPLFHRSTRSLQLTEAGQRLFDSTQHLVTELTSAVENVQDLGGQPSGTVRITIPRFIYHSLIKPVYAEFCERYPDILLEISLFDGTVDIVKQGFDLGIRFGDKIEEGVVAKELLPPMSDCLVVSRHYAEKYGIPQSPQELITHKIIGYRFITSHRLLPLYLNDNGRRVEVDIPASIIVDDEFDLMVDATRKGLGIGRIFQSTLNLQPDKADFVPILSDYWIQYPPVYLYYLQNSQKLKRVKVLIDFLMEKAALYF